ncbi:MAG: carboxypeptidase regulatory-like domain-containing protein [Fimbriiglobus sp.]
MKFTIAVSLAFLLAAFSFAEPPQQTVIVEVYRNGKLATDAEIYALEAIENKRPGFTYDATKAKLVGKGGRLETPVAAEFLAKDSQGHIGSMKARGLRETSNVRIDLLESQTVQGRVVDSEGKPVVGMKLDARFWTPPLKEERTEADYNLYATLSGMNWTCTTDAEGRFTSPAFPKGYTLILLHQLANGTKIQLQLSNTKKEFVLPKFGQLRLTVETDGDPIPLEKCECSIYPKNRAEVYQPDYEVKWNAKGESGPRLAEYEIHLQLPDNHDRVLVERSVKVTIQPSETTEVRLKTKKGSFLTGKIVDKKTGQGIPGLKVSAYQDMGEYGGRSTTDASGQYRMVLAESGKYFVQLNSYHSSDDRVYLAPQNRERAKPVTVPELGEAEWPSMTLDEGLTFRAKIVDKDQKPVNGPFDLEFNRADPFSREEKKADAVEGNLITIRGMPLKGNLFVQVRKGKAVNEKASFLPADCNEVQTIVIDESYSGSGAGKVTDMKGKPVAGVLIKLEAFIPYGETGSTSKTVASTRSDEKGEYRFENVGMGIRHCAVMGDPRFPKTMRFAAKNFVAGQTMKLEDFRVQVLGMSVSGQVVGLDGKPVAGVTVQSCGETPKAARTTTDANGRYKLEDLPDGRAFVTANKEGYRHTYALIVGGEEDPVNLTLRKLDEAPAPLDMKAFAAEKKKILRSMLQMTWDATPENSGPRMEIFRAAVKSHPDLAESWAKAAQGKTQEAYSKALEPRPTMSELIKLALEKPEAAVEKMRVADYGWDTFRKVAETVILKDKAKAIPIIRAALPVVRSELSNRAAWEASAIAQVASLLQRAGLPAEAKPLYEEADKLVLSLDKPDLKLAAQSWIAPSFVDLSLDEAMSRLNLLGESTYRTRASCKVLGNLARIDPKQAIEKMDVIVKQPRNQLYHHARISIAEMIVDTQPDLAIKLIDEDPNPGSQVYGYLELAKLLVKADAAKAHDLIDRAMKVLEDSRTGKRRYQGQAFFPGGIAHGSAHVAYVARTLNHPDCHSLVARALINREQREGYDISHGTTLGVAFTLGAVDPEAGRWLFGTVHSDNNIPQLSERAAIHVLALTDPLQYSEWLTKQMGKAYDATTWSRLDILNTLSALADPAKEIETLGVFENLFYRANER